jgi:hypothetical protein
VAGDSQGLGFFWDGVRTLCDAGNAGCSHGTLWRDVGPRTGSIHRAQNTVTKLAMLKVEQVRTTAFDSELLFLNVVQVLDFVRNCVWFRTRCTRGFRLKILVSVVRFRPRPPVSKRPSARKGSGAFLHPAQIFACADSSHLLHCTARPSGTPRPNFCVLAGADGSAKWFHACYQAGACCNF